MVHAPSWVDFVPCSVDLLAPPPCVTVSLQGLDFVSGSRALSRITLGAWDGWTNGTARTGGPVAWDTADGGIPADVYEGSRRITLEGLIIERSPRALWERMEELGSILTTPRWDHLIVDEEHLGLVRQILVTRLQRPMITPRSSRIAAYTLELEAAANLRTDVDLQSATVPARGVDVRNIGTAPAATTVRLVGPLSNPGLSWPGGSWSYQGSVASGQTVLVEMWRRRVVDEATATHSRTRAQGSWLAVPPGTTPISRTGTGSGRVELEWRSSWG